MEVKFRAFSGHSNAIISAISALLLLGASIASGCSPAPATSITTADGTALYLSQRPPGQEPEIFAPGIVSIPGFMEYSGTFSPDGTEYYFYRFSDDARGRLLCSKLADGKWTSPEQCAFTGAYPASEPLLTFDNKTLYFMWNRPVPQGEPGYGDEAKYYFVDRTPDGWSEPRYAGQGMFLSSSRDGSIYTTDMSSSKNGGSTYLAKVTVDKGLFTKYERMNIKPYPGMQAHPCIAPDGSYILFDVNGGSHLFISFKKTDGAWGEAIDLAKHGFDKLAGGATISPDGKYLFFSLNDDIWWVDIKVIESLKTKS